MIARCCDKLQFSWHPCYIKDGIAVCLKQRVSIKELIVSNQYCRMGFKKNVPFTCVPSICCLEWSLLSVFCNAIFPSSLAKASICSYPGSAQKRQAKTGGSVVYSAPVCVGVIPLYMSFS